MAAIIPTQLRIPAATKAKIEALAAKWGGIAPATRTAVIVEAIDRAHQAEFPDAPRKPKRS